MMLRYSFDLDEEADAIEKAVKQVLEDGLPHHRYHARRKRARRSIQLLR